MGQMNELRPRLPRPSEARTRGTGQQKDRRADATRDPTAASFSFMKILFLRVRRVMDCI
jgi:hypothetical protein